MRRMMVRLCLLFAFLSIVLPPAHGGEVGATKASTQLVVVTTPDWNTNTGMLRRYQRSAPDKKWAPVGDPIAVVVGKSGLGWGAGLVQVDQRIQATGPVKKEGDGRSPAGTFQLGTSFGYAAQSESGWKMPYVNLTPSIMCIEDANSKFYNSIVDRDAVTPDWDSTDLMLRDDNLYRWGLFVDHNSQPPKPGGGSCIFMHVWEAPGVPTAGCTAMSQEHIESVLAWLDPAKKPLLVQLPEAQYERLESKWNLPRS